MNNTQHPEIARSVLVNTFLSSPTVDSNVTAILNSVKGLIWSVDKDFCLRIANHFFLEEFSRVTGMKLQPGDCIFNGSLDESTISRWKRYYSRALEGETFVVEDSVFGIIAEVSFNPIREGEHITGVACFLTDVSHSRKQKKQLLESEQMMLMAEKVASFGYWQLDLRDADLKSNTLHWSDEVYRIFETTKTEVEPSPAVFYSFVHPEDRESLEQSFSLAVAQRQVYNKVHRVITAKGNLKWVHEHCGVITNEDGVPQKVIGTVQDITERKHACIVLK